MSWTVFRNRWISYRQLQVSRGIQVRWQYFTSSLAPRPPGANFLFIRRHTVPSSPSVPYLSSNGIVGSLGWRKGAFRSILEFQWEPVANQQPFVFEVAADQQGCLGGHNLEKIEDFPPWKRVGYDAALTS